MSDECREFGDLVAPWAVPEQIVVAAFAAAAHSDCRAAAPVPLVQSRRYRLREGELHAGTNFSFNGGIIYFYHRRSRMVNMWFVASGSIAGSG